MAIEHKITHKKPNWFRGFLYYLRCKTLRHPPLVNIEFTKRCNARCSFCQYWQLESPGELLDYGPVIKRFKPVVVSISGGEPLIRKNYADLIKSIRPHAHYMSLITNGALLNEESAKKLIDAGINHISVSLDYLNEEHDKARNIKGLYKHISETIPKLASLGIRLSLNTIIMESNLDQILPIAYRAKEWGVSVSYSAFCTLKIDNDEQMIRQKRLKQLSNIIKELIRLKRKLRNIRNSDFYLKHVPTYFREGHVCRCRAGTRWIHITPDGFIQPCSELPRVSHYTDYKREKMKMPACTKCWYTCRGEAEASHLHPRRFWELVRS